jgi:hypothetical protein
MDLRAARSGVTGAKTGAVIVVQRTSMVRLPGAACADELTDAEGELDALTKASAFGLAERVAAAANALQRARLVADFLQDRRSRLRATDLRVQRAAALLRANSGGVAISALAQQVGVGERQLERAVS